MIRSILLSTLLAITAVTGVSLTPSEAAAQPPGQRRDYPERRDRRDHHVHFEVLVRHRGHWDSHGTYHNRNDAERAAWQLRRQGHEVRIEREYVRGR